MTTDPKAAVPKVKQAELYKIFSMVDFKPNQTLKKDIEDFFAKQKETEKEISYD